MLILENILSFRQCLSCLRIASLGLSSSLGSRDSISCVLGQTFFFPGPWSYSLVFLLGPDLSLIVPLILTHTSAQSSLAAVVEICKLQEQKYSHTFVMVFRRLSLVRL